MRPAWLALGLVCIGLSLAGAQERKFPYEAVLDVEDDFVRCGPGPKYYPTGKLRRGERVTVHRHDPGGWAMIAPPAGSFSWIQSEYVQKAASGRGSLTANNVIVHVGSSLGTERSVYQRTLSKGDTVEILGEETLPTERGPLRMYKIKPPSREYRWIAGKSIVAAAGAVQPNPAVRPEPNNKPAPFIQGPIATETEMEVAAESDVFEPSPFGSSDAAPESARGGSQEIAATPVSTEPVAAGSLEDLRLQLAKLDQQFREMLQADPQTWDLASLKSSYVSLETAAQHPAFTSHVQQRLGTIQRYAKIQSDYVEFYRLTSETQERDAQLLSLQKENEAKLKVAASGQTAPVSSPPASMPPNELKPVPNSGANPSGSPQSVPAQPIAAGAQHPPKFSGAGIVQRSSIPAPGVPPYMLLAPDGRLLAYLEPAPGIDLSHAQNQALGIIGERGFREDLKTDVIVVRGYQPVILRSTLP